MNYILNHWPLWFISLAMIVAAVIDGWKLKVPNWLTFPLILSGWALGLLHTCGLCAGATGTGDVWASLAGAALGFALLFPVYAIGGMGAGDVKMQMGFGAWIGAFTVDWRRMVLGLNALLGFALSTLLFAMLFKYVPPDQKIRWRDVWVGSIVTATLFLIGKLLIVTFLSRFAFRSAYGIAGSFLVLLLWVYYSTQIFLLGAEFTHKYALAHRSGGTADGRADAHAAPPMP